MTQQYFFAYVYGDAHLHRDGASCVPLLLSFNFENKNTNEYFLHAFCLRLLVTSMGSSLKVQENADSPYVNAVVR